MENIITINNEEYIKKSSIDIKSATRKQISHGLKEGDLRPYEVQEALLEYMEVKLDGITIYKEDDEYKDDMELYLLLDRINR